MLSPICLCHAHTNLRAWRGVHMSDRALTLETNANLIGWMSSFSQWTQNHVI
jgi:hypothetical protein